MLDNFTSVQVTKFVAKSLGLAGRQGEYGDKGELIYPPNIKGYKGGVGDKGFPGYEGPIGPMGPAGPPGLDGFIGIKGEKVCFDLLITSLLQVPRFV